MNIWNVITSVVFGALGGGIVTPLVFGLIRDRWIESVRAKYAGELESFRDSLIQGQKHMQARIDCSVFVSRAQFDTEFLAMKEIFRMLTEVRLNMELIRPRRSTRPMNQTDEERMKGLLSRLDCTEVAFNSFSTQLESLSPFYPLDLYECLLTCRDIVYRELIDVKTSGNSAFGLGWYDFGEESSTRLTNAYKTAAKIIRERIARLSVVS